MATLADEEHLSPLAGAAHRWSFSYQRAWQLITLRSGSGTRASSRAWVSVLGVGSGDLDYLD
jgi:hypothetical protein